MKQSPKGKHSKRVLQNYIIFLTNSIANKGILYFLSNHLYEIVDLCVPYRTETIFTKNVNRS